MASAADEQLDRFIARYTPEVAAVARAALTKLKRRMPTAQRLVYDNYNALAIAFGAGERKSGLILSLALYPRWVSLFLIGGPHLPDPDRRLKGAGAATRHVVLETAATLDEPAIVALIDAAIARAPPLPPTGKGKTIIKSISPRQRPRRPA